MQVRVGARDKGWWGCEIILFAVEKEWQKRGIGKRQLAAIVSLRRCRRFQTKACALRDEDQIAFAASRTRFPAGGVEP